MNAQHGQSRRSFCRTVAAATVAALPFRDVTALAQQTANDGPRGRYIDVHTHLGQTWNTTATLKAEQLLAWMDANQIEQAVVLPLVSPESSSYLLTTDFVLAETKPHRDRLIPFCCVDPRTSFSGGQKALVDILKRYIDAGAKGFGEHKPGVMIDDPRSQSLYAACGEVQMPVLFHLDEQRNMDVPGLPGLEAMLKKFPDTVFIGHGPGWWASISGDVKQSDLGGYPTGPVAAGGAIDRLMEKYPNLYGDLSAGSGAGAITRDPEFGKNFLVRRANRLLFGTDFLAPDQKVPQLKLFAELDLAADVQSKIFRENARKILRLN